MDNYNLYDIVTACAGGDKNKLYAVIGGDGKFVLLADGKTKTIEKPKKKNIKHTSRLAKTEPGVIQPKDLTNKKIRRLITEYRKSKLSLEGL
jgi:hypothetical protein